jgi:hypothetical protein
MMSGTSVSRQGIEKLKAELPGVEINGFEAQAASP